MSRPEPARTIRTASTADLIAEWHRLNNAGGLGGRFLDVDQELSRRALDSSADDSAALAWMRGADQ